MYRMARLTQLPAMIYGAKVNWQHRLYRRRLARQTIEVPTDRIALSYGPGIGDELRQGKHLMGGKVKLTYLHQRYPHDGNRFNILYLVSSALPCHSAELVRWARNQGAKIVLNQNGVAYPAWTSDHVAINTELATVLTQADLVIYQSQFCKQGADRFLGEPPALWKILPNCVDIARFTPINRAFDGTHRLLIAGTHYHRERVTLPLHAVHALADKDVPVRLTIAGRLAWPDGENEVRNLIAHLKLAQRVTVTGPFTHSQAPSLYSSHDMFLHLKHMDPCPNVVIEAMASGLPVIGSGSGGMAELVQANGGLLLPVSNSWEEFFYPSVGDLCDAIMKVGASIVECRLRARRHAAEHFSSEDWLDNHARLFSTLPVLTPTA